MTGVDEEPEVPRDDRAILRAVEQVVRTHLDRDVTLSPEVSLVEAMELDSIRRLTLVIEIENRFRICFDDDDEAALETVGDLVAAIRRRL